MTEFHRYWSQGGSGGAAKLLITRRSLLASAWYYWSYRRLNISLLLPKGNTQLFWQRLIRLRVSELDAVSRIREGLPSQRHPLSPEGINDGEQKPRHGPQLRRQGRKSTLPARLCGIKSLSQPWPGEAQLTCHLACVCVPLRAWVVRPWWQPIRGRQSLFQQNTWRELYYHLSLRRLTWLLKIIL